MGLLSEKLDIRNPQTPQVATAAYSQRLQAAEGASQLQKHRQAAQSLLNFCQYHGPCAYHIAPVPPSRDKKSPLEITTPITAGGAVAAPPQ